MLRQEKQLRATEVKSLGAELEGKEKSLKTLSQVNSHSHLDFLFRLGLVRKKERNFQNPHLSCAVVLRDDGLREPGRKKTDFFF